jgi:hypothetical protein
MGTLRKAARISLTADRQRLWQFPPQPRQLPEKTRFPPPRRAFFVHGPDAERLRHLASRESRFPQARQLLQKFDGVLRHALRCQQRLQQLEFVLNKVVQTSWVGFNASTRPKPPADSCRRACGVIQRRHCLAAGFDFAGQGLEAANGPLKIADRGDRLRPHLPSTAKRGQAGCMCSFS